MIFQELRLGRWESGVFAEYFSDRVWSDSARYLWEVSFVDERFHSTRVPVHPDAVECKNAPLKLWGRSLLRDLFQLSVVEFVDVLLSLSKQSTVQHSSVIARLAVREVDRVNRSRLLHNVENFVRRFQPSEFNSDNRSIDAECCQKIAQSLRQFALADQCTADQNSHDLCFKLSANFLESLNKPT